MRIDFGQVNEFKDRSAILFLGLYLLLLAFFILLNGISQIEETKTKAVVGSLTATFRADIGKGTGIDIPSMPSALDDFLAAQAFQNDVSNLFHAVIPLSEVQVSRPGELMTVIIPVASLFETASDAIRESRLSLVERIARALDTAPEGTRYDVEFVVGSPSPVDGNTAPPVLGLARAAAFARALEAAGAPGSSLGVGLKPGAPGQIFIAFLTQEVPVAGDARTAVGEGP
ncbi:MAG: hypothetical protein HOH66_00520 [Rhodospirillaceae bacterium]|jgi:hypothetical protein|nr:hypothetical protein [Rhodospirillaceae bacterium]MBT6116332.1 hypothetical protein [Rhodospirillaceae bacterium]